MLTKVNISCIAALCLLFTTNLSIEAQVPAYVAPDGLLGYWGFNGNAIDESGNGNDGVVNGATLTEDRFGNANSAYNFDGVDDNILLPNLGFSDAFTISAYINAASLTPTPTPGGNDGFRAIIGDNDGWSNPDIHWSVTNVGWDARVAAQPISFDNSMFSLNDCLENWVHVAYSHDNNANSKLYINGQPVDEITAPTVQASLNVLAIGSQFNNTRFWHGELDDFGIWSRALTEEEVMSLYQPAIPGCTDAAACNYSAGATEDDGSCTYLGCAGSEDNQVALLINESPQSGYQGRWANAFVTNGELLRESPNNTWSFAAWVNLDPASSAYNALIGTGLWWGNGYRIWINNNTLYSYFRDESSTNGTHRAAGVVTAGQWVHVAVTHDGNERKHYVDGALVGTWSEPYTFEFSTANGVGIGWTASVFSNTYNGQIDDLSVWHQALDLDQIIALMACPESAYTGAEELVALWDFEGVSPAEHFADKSGNNHTLNTINNPLVEATIELSSCGCTDPEACDYDASASTDDGSCTYPGCTDSNACNYNLSAGCEDGSCTYTTEPYLDCDGNCLNDANGNGICDELDVSGCTFEGACNYNAQATVNDNSCFFATAVFDCDGNCQQDANNNGICDQLEALGAQLCGEGTVWDNTIGACIGFDPCPADLTNDGVVDANDILQMVAMYGTQCD